MEMPKVETEVEVEVTDDMQLDGELDPNETVDQTEERIKAYKDRTAANRAEYKAFKKFEDEMIAMHGDLESQSLYIIKTNDAERAEKPDVLYCLTENQWAVSSQYYELYRLCNQGNRSYLFPTSGHKIVFGQNLGLELYLCVDEEERNYDGNRITTYYIIDRATGLAASMGNDMIKVIREAAKKIAQTAHNCKELDSHKPEFLVAFHDAAQELEGIDDLFDSGIVKRV